MRVNVYAGRLKTGALFRSILTVDGNLVGNLVGNPDGNVGGNTPGTVPGENGYHRKRLLCYADPEVIFVSIYGKMS